MQHCSGKPGLKYASVISSKICCEAMNFYCSITSYCKTSVLVWVRSALGRFLHPHKPVKKKLLLTYKSSRAEQSRAAQMSPWPATIKTPVPSENLKADL